VDPLRQSGSLAVVGLGLQVPAHVTAETLRCLESAEEVLHLVADPVTTLWLEQVNPKSRSLNALYEPGRRRRDTYSAIVDEVLARLDAGGEVCFALYGHPGVFATPAHEAIRRARADGFAARMLPGISAEDCLFADLGVDPGETGCQSYDATDLLIHSRVLDPSAALVLWQASIVGNFDYVPEGDLTRLPALAEYLARFYPPDHEVVCYVASPYPIFDPIVRRVPLSNLADAELPRLALLYLAPALRRERDESVLENAAARI
jgi:uncharacterized protein YabN with tetrapyrrole methylase and pyrophosphatase domain